MPIKCDEYGHVCVISVSGDFIAPDADEVRKAVEVRVDSRQAVNFVIDFERSRFIGSDGLETLLAVRRRCEDRRGHVRLSSLDDNCRQILHITRLDRRFECHPDVATAMKATG